MGQTPAIQAEGLIKNYGKTKALAGFDLANVLRAERIERTRLRSDDVMFVLEETKTERANAIWVTCRNQRVLGDDGDRVGAA